MSLSIVKYPISKLHNADYPFLFTVKDDAFVGSNFNVSFIAEIWEHDQCTNPVANGFKSATMKVTPNAVGRGIFDMRSVCRNLVSSDTHAIAFEESATAQFWARMSSQAGGMNADGWLDFPIHCIDNQAHSKNSLRFIKIVFKIQGSATQNGEIVIDSGTWNSNNYLIYNGQWTRRTKDLLNIYEVSQGDVQMLPAPNDANGSFLTNAPAHGMNCGINSFMTLGRFYALWHTGVSYDMASAGNTTLPGNFRKIRVSTWSNGIETDFQIYQNQQGMAGGTNGNAYDWDLITMTDNLAPLMQYIGVGCQNLKNASGILVGLGYHVNGMQDCDKSQIMIRGYDDFDGVITKDYWIDVVFPKADGTEIMTLTWLNPYGAWDYYTFYVKTKREFKRKQDTYMQTVEDYSGFAHKTADNRGGKRTYDSPTITQSIILQTDLIDQDVAYWLEELYLSREVYLLRNGDEFTPSNLTPSMPSYNQFWQIPVTLTDTKFARLNSANDKLMKYAFTIETAYE